MPVVVPAAVGCNTIVLDPLTESAPPSRSIESLVILIVPPTVMLLETVVSEAETTVTSFTVVLPPTAPVNVTVPVPAVTVRLSVAAVVPFKVLVNSTLPPPDPVSSATSPVRR